MRAHHTDAPPSPGTVELTPCKAPPSCRVAPVVPVPQRHGATGLGAHSSRRRPTSRHRRARSIRPPTLRDSSSNRPRLLSSRPPAPTRRTAACCSHGPARTPTGAGHGSLSPGHPGARPSLKEACWAVYWVKFSHGHKQQGPVSASIPTTNLILVAKLCSRAGATGDVMPGATLAHRRPPVNATRHHVAGETPAPATLRPRNMTDIFQAGKRVETRNTRST